MCRGLHRYDQRSADSHDPAPLRNIRQAVSQVQQETQAMGLRIGWLQSKLLAENLNGVTIGGAGEGGSGSGGGQLGPDVPEFQQSL